MKLKTLNGRERDINVSKWRIDWDRKVSGPQKQVKDFLYPYWHNHVVLEELMIPGSRLRIDLISLTRLIAIEVSPRQHYKINPFFHKTKSGYLAAMKRDVKKEEWITAQGWTYVEVMEEDMDDLSPEWFKQKYDITL